MIFNNKRGVSEIIGYILLIAIVVVISIFVYGFLKTFVPQESLTCPDGTSVSVSNFVYNCTMNTLNFSLDNSGTFSIAGYFIHASNDSTQQIATLDLTSYYSGPSSYHVAGSNAILFTQYGSLDPNNFDPGKEKDITINAYNLSLSTPQIASGAIIKIEIVPIRYVEFNGKNRQASCGNAKIDIPISCS
jgi:flagellin-like protein